MSLARETDRRHGQVFTELFASPKAKVAATPRMHIGNAESAITAASQRVFHEDCILYRNVSMRTAYPAVDRPDREALKVL